MLPSFNQNGVACLLFLLFLASALFCPLTPAADCHFRLPGDLNNDCTVNLEDFAVVAEHWLIDCTALYDPACVPLDLDKDGFDALNDCDDNDPNILPGAHEYCDGLDNDCDAVIDDDCSDCIPEPEICDGLDNDCDSVIDEDTGGETCDTGMPGTCSSGLTVCESNSGFGVVTCVPIQPPEPEICDGIDNDCDGMTDEDIPGAGGPCNTGLEGPCSAGILVCTDSMLMCMPDYEPVPEVCNGLDDDCNGMIDEDTGGGACDNSMDTDLCMDGVYQCISGEMLCSDDSFSLQEVCDSVDNDCDGMTDEGLGGASCDTGLAGICTEGTTVCTDGMLMCTPNQTPQAEICNNGLDDDCNGLTDMEDPECL